MYVGVVSKVAYDGALFETLDDLISIFFLNFDV